MTTDFDVFIQSPALKKRSDHYPEHFADRVPYKITATQHVEADIPMFAQKAPGIRAVKGETYLAWTNQHGAVCAVINGEKLGMKPDEFTVTEWANSTHFIEHQTPEAAHAS